MSAESEICRRVDDCMTEVVEAVAPEELLEHVATCDRCRDARYEAERAVARIAEVARGYALPEGLEKSLLARVAALDPDAGRGGAEASAPSEGGAAGGPRPAAALAASASNRAGGRGGRPVWLLLAAASLAAAVLWLRPGGSDQPATIAAAAWQGRVVEVERAFGSGRGLEACPGGAEGSACQLLPAGGRLGPGGLVRTDGLTRALLEMSDGSVIALDRGSELHLDPAAPRRGRLSRGNLIAEVRRVAPKEPPVPEGAARAVIDLPGGRAEVLGTKFALRAQPQLSRVEVSRGEVRLIDDRERELSVKAGEAGSIGGLAAPAREPVLDLAQTFGWQARAFDESVRAAAHGALGSLTAKRPQSDQELDGAVRLVRHDVRVRIVDNVARTEVEEVFQNTTDQVLEGIYRFPLPPDAQIERLALEVDGKLVEGAFVERERAAAIWRGAIVNAGGSKPPPRDEIIWVPGPWKDPALLEWQRGTRFELRIYPIPKQGARRIVLAYTEVLGPAQGGRRYVYPLPHDPGQRTRIDRFTVDVQVRGHDGGAGVQVEGYALNRLASEPGVARLALDAREFVPAGDLELRYRLPDEGAPLRAWAYDPSGDAPGELPYVALSLRPELPSRARPQRRAFVLVVDTSRSMIGESKRQASALVEQLVREMDRDDRVAVMACDSLCQSLPGGFLEPGSGSAARARGFLDGIEAEGASDLGLAVQEATALAARAEGRALRVIYLGDGTPTVGEVHPALVQRAVKGALPAGATLSAVAVGVDADRKLLRVAASAGGGVVLPLSPGHSLVERALSVLGESYGHALREARVVLPPELTDAATTELGTLAAGSETLVVARLAPEARGRVEGRVVLRGWLAGEPFERSYPLELSATTSRGNAFVPRLYAARVIEQLDGSLEEEARRRSIELSKHFAVASRYTSLLVLESQAMYRAFGLQGGRAMPLWTGDRASHAAQTWGEGEEEASDAEEQVGVVRGPSASAPASPAPKDDWGRASAASGAGSDEAEAPSLERSRRSATSSAAAPVAPRSKSKRARMPRFAEPPGNWPSEPRLSGEPSPVAPSIGEPEIALPGGRRRVLGPAPVPGQRLLPSPVRPRRRTMVPMRRVWERTGSLQVPPVLWDEVSERAQVAARQRAERDALRREALKAWYVTAFRAGDLDQAAAAAQRWSDKDPLDPDALTARADLAAQQGDRERSIRILGSVVDVRPGDHKAQWRLARLHRWAGHPERGCRHSLAVAQIKLRDERLVAEAIECARGIGRNDWAEGLLAALDPGQRRKVERAGGRLAEAAGELRGDLRLEASWEGGRHDLDLVIVHPDGFRVSWLGAPTRSVITARDVRSVFGEGLALRGAKPGRYALEIVRSSGEPGPVRASVQVQVGKTRRTIPLELTGDRLRFATARIRTHSRLVRARDVAPR